MKINRSFLKDKRFFLFLFAFFLFVASLRAAAISDQSEWLEDGRPLRGMRERPILERIWNDLENDAQRDDNELDLAIEFQLRKQSSRYKGRRLVVKGRLLRAAFVPTPTDDVPDAGFYDLWILPNDSKRDPLRVLAKNKPEGFQLDDKIENDKPRDPDVQYRRETIQTIAVYYRTTAFDAGDDILVVPTLVALDFHIQSSKGVGQTKKPQDAAQTRALILKMSTLPFLILLWFFSRRFLKKRLERARRPNAEKIVPFLLIAATSICARVQAQTPVDDDLFWSTIASASVDEWKREAQASRPTLDDASPEGERRRQIAVSLLKRTKRQLTASILRERANDAFRATSLAEYALDAPERQFDFFSPEKTESVGYFTGDARAIEKLRSEDAGERDDLELYRVVVDVAPNRSLVVYTHKPPQFDVSSNFFDAPQISRRVAGVGIAFGGEERDGETTSVVLAPRVAWFPTNSPPGRLGVDLNSFADVPIYPVDALAKAKTDDERRKIASVMRWTTADREPFYQMLAAYKRGRPNDKRTSIVDVAPLFNRPEEQRGLPVALRGWLRRVNLLLVDDPDVIAATGIDRYYQLYLFTNDSQGYPLVLCVPELPEGLEPGAESVRREIEFKGYFYKTWAFKNSKERSSSDTETKVKNDEEKKLEVALSWARSPVLIGAVEKVYPQEKTSNPPIKSQTIFVSFAVLVILWIVLRRIVQFKTARTLQTSRKVQ